MADAEHKTVVLSIFATLLAALVIFVATIAISGGISVSLVQAYVLPLVVSSFTLAVFAGILFAKQKGKIPGFAPGEPPKEKKAESSKLLAPGPRCDLGPRHEDRQARYRLVCDSVRVEI